MPPAGWLAALLPCFAMLQRCHKPPPRPAWPLPSPEQVRATLQGQPIPRNLLNEHPAPPLLDMAFSSNLDLKVTTQSYCTR